MTKTLFLGSKKLGLEILKRMVNIAPDSIAAAATLKDEHDARGCYAEFEAFCAEKRIPLRLIAKNADLEATIAEFKPDLCIVNGYYRILKKSILESIPMGCAGIHGSLLPAYRGGSPLVWAIINGDKGSGITFFYFDEGVDSGDIIAQKEFEIETNDDIGMVLKKVEALSIAIIEENYKQLLDGKAVRRKQSHEKASFTAMRRPEDGKINWNWPAKRIYDFVRAQTKPYPGAFTHNHREDKLIIWKADMFERSYFGSPGKVVKVSDNEVLVTCGENEAIRILQAENAETGTDRLSEIVKFNTVLK